ncbi:hypothetical protein KSF_024340 [Reticulibacter mediterranei]|uniref:TIR domain-containing protein n=1 Tax=Reticulibacter mediterranei TaxID=2778369 RepID=A0A8J3ILI7_9CHLR|nr:toll/interleukin-1 receptor domain-containing protein [Reticulibacter mediterranei]GHO92386.1 hypothetical protein KSF_024340 [Reticulibacter mediterranei]
MTPELEPLQKDFFVSYTKTDKKWAEWIAWQLEQAGYTCILQKWDFLSGGNFVLDMQNAATRTRRTIAVLSPAYLSALYTQAEWAAAFTQDPTSENGKLLPIRVQECKPPGILAAIGYIDLVGRDDQEARETLLKGVARRRTKPNTSPAFPGASAFPDATGSTGSISSPTSSPLPLTTLIVNADEDIAFRTDLEKHLRPLELAEQITIWHKDDLGAGEYIQPGIDRHFYQAKLILLLISKNFLSSADCYMLMREAMKQSNIQEARVVPIIVSPCDLEGSPISKLVTLPRNGKPIDQWSNRDSAYLTISKEIRNILPKP